MAVSEYTVVSWQPRELITEAKMDAIGNNMEYLNQNKIKGLYNADGAVVRTNLKLAGGFAMLPSSDNGLTGASVSFGEFFTPGSRPIITLGIVSDSVRRMDVTMNGYGKLFPDHQGFRLTARADALNPARNEFPRAVWVSWIAFGY